MATKKQMCDYKDKGKGYGLCELKYGFWATEPQITEKPKKVKCPKCKRRLKSMVKYCHDGCCVFHLIPPHKKKSWWKMKNNK